MKRIITLFICAVMLSALFSCSREDGGQTDGPELVPVTKVITATSDGGTFEIEYTLTNPVDGMEVSASSESDWIGSWTYSENIVAFEVAPNDTELTREALVRVEYGDAFFEVPVVQTAPGNNDEPPVPEDYDVDVELEAFRGGYVGNAYSGDRAGYQITAGTDDSYTGGGAPSQEGVHYSFEMYGPEPADMGDIYLPEGTYTFDKENTFGNFTILAGELEHDPGYFYGTVYYKREELHFESGTVTVKRDGSDNICDMEIVATLSDGSVHHAHFRGNDIFTDMSIDWIEEDISMTGIEYFQATYLDDGYRNANINIKITDSPLDASGYLQYPGNALTIVGNVKLMDNGMPAPGTWEISSEYEGPENSLWQGECVRFGSPFPTGVEVNSYDAMGNVTVGLVESGYIYLSGGGDNYEMRWEFTTRNRKKITGTYTGPIVVAGAPIVDTTLLQEDYEVNLENLNVTSCYYNQWSGDLKIDLAWMDPETFAYVGDNMRISIIPEEGVTEPVPGVYKVSATNEPGCVVAGSFAVDNLVWSLYLEFNEDGKIIRGASVRDGQLELKKNGDGTWTIDFTFYDQQDEPKCFYGTWTGVLYDLGDNPW